VAAFRGYAADAEAEIARWEANYAQLSPRHKCVHSGAARAARVARAGGGGGGGGGFAHASPRVTPSPAPRAACHTRARTPPEP
jgi:hypothetical protein